MSQAREGERVMASVTECLIRVRLTGGSTDEVCAALAASGFEVVDWCTLIRDEGALPEMVRVADVFSLAHAFLARVHELEEFAVAVVAPAEPPEPGQ